LIELTNPGAGRSQAAEQAIRSLRSSHLVLQCTGCHLPDPLGRVTWHASSTASKRPFSRFEHPPHLTQTELRECTACHVPHPLELTTESDAAHGTSSLTTATSDFGPITLQSCAKCHHDAAVGNDCATCHYYHVTE
ncbi:MAG: hypothetical protein KDB23_19835, partial [Planctomycetales bacterium]|nr:hypothetical protein [Planctomycetales bacterium]